jgi:hypothetical protein
VELDYTENLCKNYGLKILMHMTHIDNMGSIVSNGVLCKNLARQQTVPYKSIANPWVQRRRDYITTKIDGITRAIDLHNYVPTFIAKHTPMQYIITTSAPSKGRDAVVTNNNLVFILIDPIKALNIKGTLISDGNAAVGETNLYSTSDGLSKIDWGVIDCPNEYPFCYDNEWKRKKSAEILIPRMVFNELFIGIMVNCEETRVKLIQQITDLPIDKLLANKMVGFVSVNCDYYI